MRKANNRILYEVGQIMGFCTFLSEKQSQLIGSQIRRIAEFECYCGNIFVTQLNKVKYGDVKSCGCAMSGFHNTKHGCTKTPEYAAWGKMKSRCYNVNDKRFITYGKRGIIICERWLHSFELFLSDMGKRPSPKHSIDRIDNNGNYEPSNCRWATVKEQAINKTSTLYITYKEQTKPMLEWASLFGLQYTDLYRRVNVLNWDIEKALTTPVKLGNNQFTFL